MSLFTVDAARCTGDGFCRDICPRDLISFTNESVPELPAALEAQCNLCGQCLACCPAGAIRLGKFTDQDSTELDASLNISPEAAEQFLGGRRSVRNFTAEAIDAETIRHLINVAKLAPNGMNNQVVQWGVTVDPRTTRAVADVMVDWFDTTVREDPVLSRRYNVDSIVGRYRAGKEIILRGAPHLVFTVAPPDAAWGAVDCASALTYFALAAHARGFGTCWAGYFIRAASGSPALREFLKLGDSLVVQGAMIFGRPALSFHRTPPRNEQTIRWF